MTTTVAEGDRYYHAYLFAEQLQQIKPLKIYVKFCIFSIGGGEFFIYLCNQQSTTIKTPTLYIITQTNQQ